MLIAVSANALETLVKQFDFIALERIRHTRKALGLPVQVSKAGKV